VSPNGKVENQIDHVLVNQKWRSGINPELDSDVLQPLFIDIWEKEELPREWTQGNIVQIPKKGNLADCNNWRGLHYS